MGLSPRSGSGSARQGPRAVRPADEFRPPLRPRERVGESPSLARPKLVEPRLSQGSLPPLPSPCGRGGRGRGSDPVVSCPPDGARAFIAEVVKPASGPLAGQRRSPGADSGGERLGLD